MQDTRGKELEDLSTWTWQITDDLSKGRIISCRTKPDPVSGSTGRAIVRGSRGTRVEVCFRVFSTGGISVTSARAKSYFGRELKWSSSDRHRQTHAISAEFQQNLNNAMRKLKLEELVQMPPLKRWWHLKTA